MNVVTFPNWKAGASSAERFSELHGMALTMPERFTKVVVVYTEDSGSGPTTTRYITSGCTTLESLGMLDIARQMIHNDSTK